jgi:hypothetical protein
MNRNTDWAGDAAVDSGLLLVGDPCALLNNKGGNEAECGRPGLPFPATEPATEFITDYEVHHGRDYQEVLNIMGHGKKETAVLPSERPPEYYNRNCSTSPCKKTSKRPAKHGAGVIVSTGGDNLFPVYRVIGPKGPVGLFVDLEPHAGEALVISIERKK